MKEFVYGTVYVRIGERKQRKRECVYSKCKKKASVERREREKEIVSIAI